MNKNIIKKTKFIPFEHIKPQKNTLTTKDIIGQSLSGSSTRAWNKENKLQNLNKPKYFYQRKKVIDKKIDFSEVDNFDYGDNIIQTKIHEPTKNINKINNTNKTNTCSKKNLDYSKIKNQEFKYNMDIDVSCDLRGNCTRLSNEHMNREKETIENMRFDFLTKNFQDPDKIVLPFPRGGELTREKYIKSQNSRIFN